MNVIYGANIAALLVYLYIGEAFLKRKPAENSGLISNLLVAMAVVESLVVIANFKTSPFLLKLFYKPAGPAPIVQYAVVLWAVCESIAIFGIVAIVLGGGTQIQLACTLMSLLCFWLARPQSIREQIERQRG